MIDQVWHEHLLFSRAYREFCRDVLHRDFDHNPELVPSAEQSDAFAEQYLATLDAYRTEFNAMPPVDIWSVPKFKTQEKKRAPKKLKEAWSDGSGDTMPLYEYYSAPSEIGVGDGQSHFGGGGDFHGGGADRSWDSDGGHDSGGHGGSDSGDGGSSCGSSCSSSCGSSCGGGGE